MTINKIEPDTKENENDDEKEWKQMYDILKNSRLQKWDSDRLRVLNQCKEKLNTIYKKF